MARYMTITEVARNTENYCYSCGKKIEPNITFYDVVIGNENIIDVEPRESYSCCSTSCINEVVKSWFKWNYWDLF